MPHVNTYSVAQNMGVFPLFGTVSVVPYTYVDVQ